MLITASLTEARRHLVEARRQALAQQADATYGIARGHISPLVRASGITAQIDSLLHSINHLIKELHE